MKISIGIMAHNEAGHIRDTLTSLAAQDLLTESCAEDLNIDIVCVANGCTDDTAAVAEQALQDVLTGRNRISARVGVVDKAGKSHAWNEYVHRLSSPGADYLFLMDSDIRFGGTSTLRHMLEALASAPEAHVAVDTILKDIVFKEKKTAFEKMSLAASDLSLTGPAKIAGSLYCGRGAVLRSIWMPVGLLVEDGFLRAMITTDNFTRPEMPDRIVRAPEATHIFEAVTHLPTLFRHEVRLVVGSAMNFILFDYLSDAIRMHGGHAGVLIQRLNEEKPDWFPALIRERIQACGIWAAPTAFIALPLKQWRRLPVNRAWRRLPSALGRALFNLAAACAANRKLKRNEFRW
jgi:glycosyltransferase involved in cell wall biosynthesis